MGRDLNADFRGPWQVALGQLQCPRAVLGCGVQGAGFGSAVSVHVEMFYCYICKELIDKVPVGGAEEYTV